MQGMENIIMDKTINTKLMLIKKKYLEQSANKILKTYERFDKLKELGQKKLNPKK